MPICLLVAAGSRFHFFKTKYAACNSIIINFLRRGVQDRSPPPSAVTSRRECNVLVPFYRGAWGSGGTFSVTHTLEDAQTSIDFLRDAENAKKFRIDPNYIVLVGHSMGGFVAAYATAHEPKVFAVALISAANLGPASARQRVNDPQFWERWNDNASRLVGTTAEALVKELDSDSTKWNYMNCVPLLKDRPVLVLEADDRNTSDNQELADRLRKGGDARITEVQMHTDHLFSDHRIAMQAAIVNRMESIMKKPA